MKKRLVALCLVGCCALAVPAPAQEAGKDSASPKVEVLGKVALEEGQFVKCSYTHLANGSGGSGYTREVMPFRPWVNNAYSEIGLKATLNSHFSAVFIPQIKLWDDTWDWQTMGENGSASNPFNQHVTASLDAAEGILDYGSKESVAFRAEVGVMPYKYNGDAKNLGEYLFRTGEHPAYIQTSFDFPNATLTGIRLNADMFKNFSVDLLLTEETQVMPLNDVSLSVLAGYKVPGLLDIGAGVMFDRLIPMAGKLDAPVYLGDVQDTFYTSNGTLDTLKWGGTKVMAHVAFDPKGLLPASITRLLGNDDGRIYAEAAILGLSSFTAYKKAVDSTGAVVSGRYVVDDTLNFYSDIGQRIPIMAGFNIPTFKLLDYLSLEVEWFGWPYSPSLYNYSDLIRTFPQPIVPKESSANGTIQNDLYTKSNAWKFSINLRKKIWGHFSVIGQIARDHTRHDVYYSGFYDPEEVFIRNDEWGWWLKLQYAL